MCAARRSAGLLVYAQPCHVPFAALLEAGDKNDTARRTRAVCTRAQHACAPRAPFAFLSYVAGMAALLRWLRALLRHWHAALRMGLVFDIYGMSILLLVQA